MNDKKLNEYARLWGARSIPFVNTDKAEEIFHNDNTRKALKYLQESAALRSVMLLYGESGTGKSTLVKDWMAQLDSKRFTPIIITQSTLSGSGLFSYLLRRLGIPAKMRRSDNLINLENALKSMHNTTIVLALDDAQNYPPTALMEIRLLLELNENRRSTFALIMIGDLFLEDMLKLKHHQALCSRISISFELPALQYQEVKDYLQHRLKQSAINRECLEETAIILLTEASECNLRLLTLLAARSWIFASEDKAQTIGSEHVRQAIELNPMARQKTRLHHD